MPLPLIAAMGLLASPAGGGTGAAAAPESFARLHAETRAFRAGRPVSPQLLPGGGQVLFLRSPPRSPQQTLFAMRLPAGETGELVSAEALAALGAGEAGEAEKARLERQHVTAAGITRYQVVPDGETIVVSAGGRVLAVDRASGRVRVLPAPPGALDPRLSPDGRLLAFVSGGELHVLDLAGGEPRRLTGGASEWITHGLAEYVAQEEMDRPEGYWWSPDASLLLFQETDDGPVEKLFLPDPARPERAPVPIAYPRAGGENSRVRLGLVPVAGGDVTWVAWDRDRYPYLARVLWGKGSPPLVVVQTRSQTEQVLLAVDPASGATRALHVEKDADWLNLHPDLPRWLPDGSGLLWFTERNGGPEVELRRPNGELAQSIVPPGGFVRLAGVDPASGWIYFTATRADPTQERVFRVRPGGRPEEVFVEVERPATLSAQLAVDGSLLLVTSTGPSGVPSVSVHRPDGRQVAVLPSAGIAPPLRPTTEVRRVGPRGLWTSVTRPRDFRRGARYPVIVRVYGGPQHLEPVLRTGLQRTQWMADQGYIVVSVLNRGETMRLGRAFERAVKGDLAGPALDDQVEGLRALGAEVPEMDLGRVGIAGGSFGGYLAALAVLRRPDVFRAAVAEAPVADWRDYDTHYTERYLGLPSEAAKAYERSSLLTWAGAAETARPILVFHGTADDNVLFLHSVKLADALLRAGRPAALVPLAGATHRRVDPGAREAILEGEMGFLRQELQPAGR
jgi:dipeptidyl-peptidase-4